MGVVDQGLVALALRRDVDLHIKIFNVHSLIFQKPGFFLVQRFFFSNHFATTLDAYKL